MLYLKIDISSTSILGIWQLEESQDELLALLDNREWSDDILSIKSESRRLEKLAVRVLLKDLTGEEKDICYLETGKPYLEDGSCNISISHTKGYVAVFLDEKHRVGVDIEQISDKVIRVKSRYISDKEYIDPNNELEHLLLHWSAKESIYKLLDISGIELKEEVIISRFKPEEEGVFTADILKTNQKVEVCYCVTPDFVLTYTLLR